jgi:nicotinate-nucleotide adenylyltransferase
MGTPSSDRPGAEAQQPAAPAGPGEPPPRGGRRIAFFGGSFNPPHIAHVLAVVYALSVEAIDEVLVVPVFQHPFSKELVDFDARLEMCRLAVGWIPGARISDVERELGGESRTLRTLEHLTATHPDWRMRLLVGADVLGDLPKWHRFDRIAEIAPPIVLGRAGINAAGAPEAVLPKISSTEIREALAADDIEAVRSRVPSAVIEYIQRNGIYRRSP